MRSVQLRAFSSSMTMFQPEVTFPQVLALFSPGPQLRCSLKRPFEGCRRRRYLARIRLIEAPERKYDGVGGRL